MLERNKTKDVLIGVMTIAMIIVGVVFYAYKNPKNMPQASPAAITQEPQRTDFGTNLPSDFPTDIPIEKGATVKQSYSLNYTGQKQLTMVFLSTKTVKENYSLYADFLKTQSWNVSNAYENTAVSSLYGTKGVTTINITISENTTKASVQSQMSISILEPSP